MKCFLQFDSKYLVHKAFCGHSEGKMRAESLTRGAGRKEKGERNGFWVRGDSQLVYGTGKLCEN